MDKLINVSLSSISEFLKEEKIIRTTFNEDKFKIDDSIIYKGKTANGVLVEPCTVTEMTPDTLVLVSKTESNNIHVLSSQDLATGNIELELEMNT